MAPRELFELPAGLAEHSYDLAVQRYLVDSAGEGIDGVQVLRGPWRNAKGPGSPRREISSTRRRHRRLPEEELCIRRSGGINLNHSKKLAIGVEHLDPGVAAVGDIDVLLVVDHDVVRSIELARLGAARAPRGDPFTIFGELRHARVYVAIRDVYVSVAVPRDIGRLVEQAWDGWRILHFAFSQ